MGKTTNLHECGFKSVVKRDGRIVEFDPEKITVAIGKAGAATNEFGREIAESLAWKTIDLVSAKNKI